MYATKSRPEGTIFDPDFDIYSRKENCLPSSNGQDPPFPGGLEHSGPSGGSSGHSPPPSAFPTGTTAGGETIDPGTGTTATDDDKFTSTPNFPTTFHPSTHNTRYPVTERYPPPTIVYEPYPSRPRDPYRPENSASGYGAPSYANGDGYYDNSPQSGKYPARRPSTAYGGDQNNNHYNQPNRGEEGGSQTTGNGYGSYHQNRYDRNYPAPNYYPGPPSTHNKYPQPSPSYPAPPSSSSGSSNNYGGYNDDRYERPVPAKENWYPAPNGESNYHQKEKSDGNGYYNNRPSYNPPPQQSYGQRPEEPQGFYSSGNSGSGGYYSSSSSASSSSASSSASASYGPVSQKYPDQRPIRPEQPSYGQGESSSSSNNGGYQGQSQRPQNPLYPVRPAPEPENSYQRPTRPTPPAQRPSYPGQDPNRPDAPEDSPSNSYPKPPKPTPAPPTQEVNNYGQPQQQQPPPQPSTPRPPTNKYPNQSPPSGGTYDRDGPPSNTNHNNYYVTEEAPETCKWELIRGKSGGGGFALIGKFFSFWY